MASPRIKDSAWRASSKFIASLRAAATSASIHKDGCLSASLPLLASSNRERARVEVEEGIAGGSGQYLGGEDGGEEGLSSWSAGWSEEEVEW